MESFWMKKSLVFLLTLFALPVMAIEVHREQLVGEWDCHSIYQNERNEPIAMQQILAINYADGSNEAGGLLIFNLADIAFPYQVYNQGQWWINQSGDYVETVTSERWERAFSPELNTLLDRSIELRLREQSLFETLQKQSQERIEQKKRSILRIVKLTEDNVVFRDVPENTDEKVNSLSCQQN